MALELESGSLEGKLEGPRDTCGDFCLEENRPREEKARKASTGGTARGLEVVPSTADSIGEPDPLADGSGPATAVWARPVRGRSDFLDTLVSCPGPSGHGEHGRSVPAASRGVSKTPKSEPFRNREQPRDTGRLEIRFFAGVPPRWRADASAWLAGAVEVAVNLAIDPGLGGRDDRLMRAAAALGARPPCMTSAGATKIELRSATGEGE